MLRMVVMMIVVFVMVVLTKVRTTASNEWIEVCLTGILRLMLRQVSALERDSRVGKMEPRR
jgi:hypothetical protein